ncbi:hypothetical protein [Halocatena salina]|uniref:Uncharacterized protein n=1 Tax=Halocatena salina TaxID=2934340 RepID=A0A8U0A8K6_9EURY|nr:hypothetical protein [Halocatena salina]UPM45304.1 hypothetical protein MW046_19365 [Halocatena salina]
MSGSEYKWDITIICPLNSSIGKHCFEFVYDFFFISIIEDDLALLCDYDSCIGLTHIEVIQL